MYKFEQTVQHSGWEALTVEFPHSELHSKGDGVRKQHVWLMGAVHRDG